MAHVIFFFLINYLCKIHMDIWSLEYKNIRKVLDQICNYHKLIIIQTLVIKQIFMYGGSS